MCEEVPLSLLPMRRDPIVQSSSEPDSDTARFRVYAREKYDDLFEELEFRSQRAAMMHYHEANRYSRKCYYVELIAALLGASSVSGIGVFLFHWDSGSEGMWGASASPLGWLGMLGVVVAALLEFASKGSTKVIPTFSKRCEGHKKAAVGWQRLTRLTRSYRIQLRNPAMAVEDYIVWYADLIRQRQIISSIALVPSATYRAFNDPARVFVSLKKKRQMFLRYQELYEGAFNIKDDYDDD